MGSQFSPRMTGAVVLSLVLPASAALPPIYQRIAEFRAVVDALNRSPALDVIGEIIVIERVATDRYEVRDAACRLITAIVDIPQEEMMAGPRQFRVEIGEPECGPIDNAEIKRPVR